VLYARWACFILGFMLAVVIGVLLGVIIGAIPLALVYVCLKRSVHIAITITDEIGRIAEYAHDIPIDFIDNTQQESNSKLFG